MQQSEITVEVLCDKDTLFALLEGKGFKYTSRLLINDYYYTHLPLKGGQVDFRELITNSFLVRQLSCIDFKNKNKSITTTSLVYKKKEFDVYQKVIAEHKITCDVPTAAEANEIFLQSGLNNWSTKTITGYEFKRANKKQTILVQDVEGLGLFLEVEQFEYQTGKSDEVLDDLVDFLNELEIPTGTNYHESIVYRLYLNRKKAVKVNS